MIILVLTCLVLSSAVRALPAATCDRSYKKMGCFSHGKDIASQMLVNDRDPTSDFFQGHMINWKAFDISMHSLACRCSQAAREKGFTYFGIHFWGECYGGKNNHLITAARRSNECKTIDFKPCTEKEKSNENECTGDSNTVYIYSLASGSDNNVNGGYSEWSEYSGCSMSCGEGIKARERVCDNPPPKGQGEDCEGLGPSTETKTCKYKECPIHGGLTEWSNFDDCSKTCGNGVMTRSRSCTNPKPEFEGRDCSLPLTETKSCHVTECPISGAWGSWSIPGPCSVTCGSGYKLKSRSCSNPAPKYGGQDCVGDDEMTVSCDQQACPIDGGVSEWSGYSDCSSTCGLGEMKRSRTCTQPKPQHGGSQCAEKLEEVKDCNEQSCPVHGNWGKWDTFGSCSETCGVGSKTRHRKCDSPAPQHGGDDCIGESTEESNCNVKECPVDGDYSEWSAYSQCSLTCGDGTQMRTRTCTEPSPAHGGKDCTIIGEAEETRSCKIIDCPIDGKFGEWSGFTDCSVTCGGGSEHRIRECDSPAPEFGGKECDDSGYETKSCNMQQCPIDGDYSEWSAYSQCSLTCGDGTQMRRRTCTEPSPAHGGKDCTIIGEAEETRSCKIIDCPIDGQWSEFGEYGACSVSCGAGKQVKTRTCTKPAPKHQGLYCIGESTENKDCQIKKCPIDGGFSTWSLFTECSTSCGEGTKKRIKTCTNPKPAHGGRECTGLYSETKICKTVDCPVDGGWSEWSTPGSCSVSCGHGFQSRARTCSNPTAKYNGKYCEGESTEELPCHQPTCPIDGRFSSWTSFGICSTTCGTGVKTRTRLCNSPAPAHGGKACHGITEETKPCNDGLCPVDGRFSTWSTYGKCSEECGDGIKIRIRTCTNPAPSHGGRDCSGLTEESVECKDKECPINGGFTEWSTYSKCSKTCGEGVKTRQRTCTNPTPQHGGELCEGNTKETEPCKTRECPVNGGLSLWSEFTECSLTCGNGKRQRTRSCTNPSPAYGGNDCTGTLTDIESCKVKDCPINGGVSSWSAYSTCSTECGDGEQTRTRSCTNPAPAHGGRDCTADLVELKPCKMKECPVNGGFTEWSTYSKCSRTCGEGVKTRQRTCTNPTPQHGGELCEGNTKENSACKIKECPIHGGLTSWASFGACSKSCGGGQKFRHRTCSNPKPRFGGKSCEGTTKQSAECNKHQCPVDGGLSSWSTFTTCSEPCGDGLQQRHRTCTNPTPAHGGKKCSGTLSEVRDCNLKKCPVDSGYSDWTSFSACSVTCGSGMKFRTRVCKNQKYDCSGAARQDVPCLVKECPIDGGFTNWSDYGACSVSCGYGVKTRSRSCTNPAPQHQGRGCRGPRTAKATCKVQDCAVDGRWSTWTSFGKCSEHCGTGFQVRTRSCSNPSPVHGGDPCLGPSTHARTCKVNNCAIHGGLSDWSSFGACSASCGQGFKTRTRKCNNPTPAHGGKKCSGGMVQKVACKTKDCPVEGGFSAWSKFSECSSGCGVGKQERSRTCTNLSPAHGGALCKGPTKHTRSCKVKECPIHGKFSTWSLFSVCSSSCGPGSQKRTRLCNNPAPAHGGELCEGPSIESRRCQIKECPVHGGLSDWSSFGACSASCGQGFKTRTRKCNNPTPAHGGKKCSGGLVQKVACKTKDCPVDGGFTSWSSYSPCSETCGNGYQLRVRYCTNPSPIHGGASCKGNTKEKRSCKISECPVEGGFSEWSKFSKCSIGCGLGKQERSRTCTNPSPAHGGASCKGPTKHTRSCKVKECPINGNWGEFGDYGSCSATCNGGRQQRQRICNHPPAQYGGKSCDGLAVDTRTCGMEPCPVDGDFGQWTEYNVCSKSCGVGQQTKTRKCDNPAPQHGGKVCVGDLSSTRKCELLKCPVNGGFSEWSSFDTCSKACGQGTQQRYRTCTKPAPAFGGKICMGPLHHRRTCKFKECPVHGTWTAWGRYSKCSKRCGQGKRSAKRTCTNPAPQHGGENCKGTSVKTTTCKLRSCPVNGMWSKWSLYGPCSRKCGGGKAIRNRECNNPSPKHGGKACLGPSISAKSCNTHGCRVNGGWSSWSQYGACSSACGVGKQTRKRSCTKPEPQHGGNACPGPNIDTRTCKVKSCPVHGAWGSWSEYGTCTQTCNGGVRYRYRKCNSPSPSHGGNKCSGGSSMKETCNNEPCAVNGNWGQWALYGPCNRKCEGGVAIRMRQCNDPSPLHGGKNCVGSVSMVKVCNTHKCPVNGAWGGWGSWSPCTEECGGGTRKRLRYCNRPYPSNGGRACGGLSSETSKCNVRACAGWHVWGKWSECTHTCGGGVKTRTRACRGGSTVECEGQSTVVSVCNMQICPIKYFRFSDHFKLFGK